MATGLDEVPGKKFTYSAPDYDVLYDCPILIGNLQELPREFYQQKKRGFTEKELRDIIESTAGTKLDELFDYVYTTKELDYRKYFGYAGLEMDDDYRISRIQNPDALQSAILKGWLGEK